MTAQTVTQAVDQRDTGAAALVRQSRGWFATVVPSHIDAAAFVALSVGYLRRNPKLEAAANRNPRSFLAALSECARLGLVPGDTYHCVPFEDRRNDTVEITGIVDYTGEIELMYRAGAVASVKAEIVCRRDHFRYSTDMDRPEHAPDWFGERGELIGAYAYAVMKDGATSKVIVYSKAEIDRVKASAKGTDKPDSPWNKWYDRMALKTVLHRLEHFVPTSAEYRREQLRAAAEVAQQVNGASVAGTPPAAAPPAAPPQDIVDAEVVGEDAPGPERVEPAGPGSTPEPPPGRDGGGSGTTDRRVITKTGLAAVRNALDRLVFEDEGGPLEIASLFAGRPVTMLETLTRAEAGQILGAVDAALDAAQGDRDEATAEVWRQARNEREASDG